MRDIKIEKGSKWRHFKGKIIEVIEVGKSLETLEELIIYKHNNEVWVRPLEMLLSSESIKNRADNVTGQKYRFERIR